MIAPPRPPEMSAAVAAIVALGGIALMYWALVGLGALLPSPPAGRTGK